MALTLTVILAFGMWSLELYFVISFVGLLINRVLFAPAFSRPRWWRLLDGVTLVGFLLLAALLYPRL